MRSAYRLNIVNICCHLFHRPPSGFNSYGADTICGAHAYMKTDGLTDRKKKQNIYVSSIIWDNNYANIYEHICLFTLVLKIARYMLSEFLVE